ncbi:translation initiation factor IF3 [Purpureocillium lavendulum]|uniref:Translation initiation factor IF3 n=1 Tax=Purpureocillium lavendulum TaxID=1247861 RepID=A0AB34FMS7_9HYPO|nr:translation initiation factor IF3 [Purpureocillium lavendulum]
MRAPGSSCALTTRRALYRVFVSPTATAAAAVSLSLSIQLQLQRRPAVNLPWTPQQHARLFATKPPRGPPRNRRGPGPARTDGVDDDRGFDRRYTTQQDIDRSGRDRPPRDHEITDPHVTLVGVGGGGGGSGGAAGAAGAGADALPSGPQPTRLVLSRLGPDDSLRMVQPYVPADPAAGRSQPRFAVCKIVNKRDEYARQRQLKEKKAAAAAATASGSAAGSSAAGGGGAAAGKPKTKELELTWAIGAHDLATKMRQMGGFLAKGMKVELMLARKKGGKQVTADEAADVVRRVREEVAAHGAREGRPASGQVGGTMRLFLEGRAAK